jgi:hypothetical protein
MSASPVPVDPLSLPDAVAKRRKVIRWSTGEPVEHWIATATALLLERPVQKSVQKAVRWIPLTSRRKRAATQSVALSLALQTAHPLGAHAMAIADAVVELLMHTQPNALIVDYRIRAKHAREAHRAQDAHDRERETEWRRTGISEPTADAGVEALGATLPERWHINPRTGEVESCRDYQLGVCHPHEHFATEDEARTLADRALPVMFGESGRVGGPQSDNWFTVRVIRPSETPDDLAQALADARPGHRVVGASWMAQRAETTSSDGHPEWVSVSSDASGHPPVTRTPSQLVDKLRGGGRIEMAAGMDPYPIRWSERAWGPLG